MLVQGGQYRVCNLDCLTYAGNLDSLGAISDASNYEFVHGDIGDRKLVSELLSRLQPSAILHLAAESHVDRSIDGPLPFVMTNVVGTCNLLEESVAFWRTLSDASRETFRFVHVSTDEVFGDLGPTGKFDERTPYDPHSPYSASKASSDHFVRVYHDTYGLPTIITNCSNNYGPFQFPEKLIPLMIMNALSGKPLPVYGDGSNVRDWLFVDDHCAALQLVKEKGEVGQTYLIGGNCERTNLQVVQLVCSVVQAFRPGLSHDPRDLIEFVTDRPGHDRRYAVSTGKISSELQWQPEVDFEQGLETTVRWYLDNPTWVERVMTGAYSGGRLGLERGAG